MTPVAVGFRIERLREGYFRAVLVDRNGYGFFRQSICSCADQAAYGAVRGGTRPLEYLGMFRTYDGREIECDDRRCPVARSSWTWAQHGHTHGTLARLGRTAHSEKSPEICP